MQIGIPWRRLLLLAFYAGFSNPFVFGQSPLPPFAAPQPPGGTAASVSYAQEFREAIWGGKTPGGSPPTPVAGQQTTLTKGYGAEIGPAATSRSGAQVDANLAAHQAWQVDKLVARVNQLETAVARLQDDNRVLKQHAVQLAKEVARLRHDTRRLNNDNWGLERAVQGLELQMLDR